VNRLHTETRVGLLGGTFDPVHLGHLAAARAVLGQLHLDRVLFIAAPLPPHKLTYSITPFADRLAMLELALASEPNFEVSDLEADRSGPSFTIDTLAGLRAHLGPEPEIFFIIGLDAFREIDTWKSYGALVRHAHLVVLGRPPYPADLLAEVIARFFPNHQADSSQNTWTDPEARGRIHLVTMEPMDISSTMIRSKVAKGEGISGLTLASVAGFADRHNLYREEGRRL